MPRKVARAVFLEEPGYEDCSIVKYCRKCIVYFSICDFFVVIVALINIFIVLRFLGKFKNFLHLFPLLLEMQRKYWNCFEQLTFFTLLFDFFLLFFTELEFLLISLISPIRMKEILDRGVLAYWLSKNIYLHILARFSRRRLAHLTCNMWGKHFVLHFM